MSKARSIGIDIDGLIDSGAVEIVWQPPAENHADELGHRILLAIEQKNAKRVFFDGLNALRHAFVFPERLPLFINALNNTFLTSGTTVLYSMEVSTLFLPDSVLDSEMSTMTDNLILTYYVRAPVNRDSSGRSAVIDREMLVLKIRDSAFDAYPEVYQIIQTGVHFGSSDSVDLRPGRAIATNEGS